MTARELTHWAPSAHRRSCLRSAAASRSGEATRGRPRPASRRRGLAEAARPQRRGSDTGAVSQNVVVGYALERMGWFHFEQLCAALLELEGDVAPLAWAGGADRCRAVLSGTPLASPLLTRRAPEPVLLLCSWVKARKPAGLLASVDRLLAERSEDVALAKSLVILTNVVGSAELETRVRRALAGQRVTVRVLGRVEIGRAVGCTCRAASRDAVGPRAARPRRFDRR